MTYNRREMLISLALILVSVGFCLAAVEVAMRVIDKPAAIISGWRGKDAPLNEFGWRGRPIAIAPDDFVVVLVGDSQVECQVCPPDETMDVILERALRRHQPKARVVTLGAAGHGTDQEYLALQEYLARYRADLVITWVTIYNDIVDNISRSAGGGYHRFHPKPSFWLEGDTLRGPTELIDAPVYTGKLRILFQRAFEDFETDWGRTLPPPGGTREGVPTGMDRVVQTNEAIGEQRSLWSISETPRPARQEYGIRLTRALLGRMRDLARDRNAAFALMLEDNFSPASVQQAHRLGWNIFLPGKTAVVGDGFRWIMADEAQARATLRDLTEGFPTILVPIRTDDPRISPFNNHFVMPANRQVMSDLAQMLSERGLLVRPLAPAR
jgi:hypothetical protein